MCVCLCVCVFVCVCVYAVTRLSQHIDRIPECVVAGRALYCSYCYQLILVYLCMYIHSCNAWYHETVHASHMNIIALLLVKAATGLIGGDLSHELHVVADIGEDTVVSCPE